MHLELFWFGVSIAYAPVVGVLSFFLLWFQLFSSEGGILETIPASQDKLLFVVQITAFLPSVKDLEFLLFEGEWRLSHRWEWWVVLGLCAPVGSRLPGRACGIVDYHFLPLSGVGGTSALGWVNRDCPAGRWALWRALGFCALWGGMPLELKELQIAAQWRSCVLLFDCRVGTHLWLLMVESSGPL
jgi:hypothetical protein